MWRSEAHLARAHASVRASLLHTGARLFLLLVLLAATATAALLLLLPLAVLQHLLVDTPELHPHAQLPCRCGGVRLRR